MKSISILLERINELTDLQKGYLTLIIGIPISLVVVSGVYLKLLLLEGVEILILINLSLLIVFGLLGGYLGKREYLRVWAYFITTFFVIFVGLGILSSLSGSSLLDAIGFFLYPLAGIVFSIVISIFLLPTLAIGSLINKKRKEKENF